MCTLKLRARALGGIIVVAHSGVASGTRQRGHRRTVLVSQEPDELGRLLVTALLERLGHRTVQLSLS
eukprot:357904-Pleurochrysis_carterae.AAC.1